jgi:hypothetical protein
LVIVAALLVAKSQYERYKWRHALEASHQAQANTDRAFSDIVTVRAKDVSGLNVAKEELIRRLHVVFNAAVAERHRVERSGYKETFDASRVPRLRDIAGPERPVNRRPGMRGTALGPGAAHGIQ